MRISDWSSDVCSSDLVVDDQLAGYQRIDALRVAAEGDDRVAHRHQVDHARDTGEVLHQYTRRRELDLALLGGMRLPNRQRLDLRGGDQAALHVAQPIFESTFETVWQTKYGLVA